MTKANDKNPKHGDHKAEPKEKNGERIEIEKEEEATEHAAPKQHEETASEVFSSIAGSAASAFKKGKEDASRAAEKAIPVIKRTAAKGTYSFFYYVAYATVFSAEVVMDLLPEDGLVRGGLRDGASAAREAVVQRKAHRETEGAEPAESV
ncbi:MAG TPA: hypothetical protein VKZ53_12895 [Candidatus Angelobacter sp.]|nr:hypothetical protein [Candidatus Angelobacter sp.]